MKIQFFLSLLIGAILFSCGRQDVGSDILDQELSLPETPYDYKTLQLPSGVSQASTFTSFEFINGGGVIFSEGERLEVTDHGAALGRVLFYDKNLSISNTVSCGSCHHQERAFTDGEQFSKGFEGKLTDRNTMSLANPISQNNLFWDSRSFSIVDLSLKPVQNHIEMGMENLDYLVDKLDRLDYYPDLFNQAFGSSEITEERISKAIAEFVGSITTNRSRFDEDNMTDLEHAGQALFMSQETMCSSCHGGNNFAALDGPFGEYGGGSPTGGNAKGTTNIGLDLVSSDDGNGNGRFKIPSLRNIGVTAPYMHDGRFETLEEVIDHYSEGVLPHPNLDSKFLNSDGSVKRLNLSNAQKTALVAFLHSLTDEEMLTNPKYSNPFLP